MARARKSTLTPIDSIRHDERRANIPTEEQRGFVADQEAAPPSLLYPRDPSLDPQLVWQGKDEQDRAGLEAPVVPIYIQEKIHPEAIIEDFVRQAKKAGEQGSGGAGTLAEEQAAYQLNLFADFNGFDEDTPGKRLDFYSHDDGSRPHWSNRMILGDSLLVMNSLAEKEGLKGRVQMIYIDPPYGIKFGSNWQVSTRKRDVKDGSADHLTRQPEQVKAFRDTWQLGIHSYLSYLRDRLTVARELLTETGSVFVQIGDENVHLVRSILDEVFGSDNLVAQVVFVTSTGRTAKYLDTVADSILWFAKDLNVVKYRELFSFQDGPAFEALEDELGGFVLADLSSQHHSATRSVTVEFEGHSFAPPSGRQWAVDPKAGIARLSKASRIHIFSRKQIRFKKRATDYPVTKLNNVWIDTQFGAFQSEKIYVVQTNSKVITRCLLMTTDPGDLVLDPTCGSGTTATVAEQWGRRWITIDTSRVALALARTRLMSARYPWYHLAADYPDLPPAATDAEIKAHLKSPKSDKLETGFFPKNSVSNTVSNRVPDIRRGFVYRRVPHITLKSIANNPEIDAIHDKWQPQLDALRAEINRAASLETEFFEKNSVSKRPPWEEWEIPREAGERGSEGAGEKELLARWWALRRERQAEIDEAISRHADTETLYDQPYEDNKRLRVAGPFTVESLSPHRTLETAGVETGFSGKNPVSVSAKKNPVSERAADFTATILDYLRRTPVQNTRKNERLKLERLEVYPGRWLNAAGEYTDAAGEIKRAAVFIGPQHNAVSPQMIHEAAKEAVKGIGFDVLLVCGFAFDPHANEEAARYPRPVVLVVHMNPDLMMGDALLKKTGAGNLFMIFGEPDIKKETDADGRITIELQGVDIYDPTTGEVRSSDPDDIACWFIDTDYNEESFFVRHAYFTGADEPYDKLKRALRAEVDEAAWAELYRTRSRPFDRPASGRIAVKVINHYGDEALKVFEV